MRYWLRGKRGGLAGFLAIAALVIGGLGWVTAAVLRLERGHREARAEGELVEKLRLALWQLDGFVLPDLTREDARPFRHYNPDTRLAAARNVGGDGVQAEHPDWILMHFQAGNRDWTSPQLAIRGQAPNPALSRPRAQVLAELKEQWDSQSLLALIEERRPQPEVTNTAQIAVNSGSQQLQQGNQFDYDKRRNYQNRMKQEVNPAPLPERVTVHLGRQLVPVWLSGPGRPERLILVRQARIGPRIYCQGVVLDWPRLRQELAEQVHDLFPQARFVPMRERIPPRPERTMTALPIELDPGPGAGTLPPAGWTPLRIGLVIAWSAVLVALVSVGLGGWSLLDLSDRRSRFVSAVTHELRTPLTTLRLYLDMLTSGMVNDERQKADYLQTLHAETDRLNRLIANVLDFSRLEKQRPRLERSRVSLADLLEQLRSTWQTRCADADKELLIENAADPATTLMTDVHLVQQTLGNLIDNACKYSRAAADRRLWVRVRLENRRWVVEVEDRGPGIPASERRSIFSPFRRGRQAEVTAGGVGLGLALARRWAQFLGGRLTLQCGPAHSGACFRLELPS
jgi:signal transduction histidine kinase